MPRPRARELFELGGHWIAEEPGRRGLYHFWNDARTGRTRRESLGTKDLEKAKLALAAIVTECRPKTRDSALTLVFEQYFTEQTDKLPSSNAARQAGSNLLGCLGEMTKVSALDLEAQKKYAKWEASRGNSLGYAARNLGVLSAALNHCGIKLEIVTSEAHLRDVWKVEAKARRAAFVPSDPMVAAIWRQKMPDRLRRFLLIMMTTACRPEASIDLAPCARNREAGTADLNPTGRVQNKKFRPVIRVGPLLRRSLDGWEKKQNPRAAGDRYVGYASVDSADTALARVCEALGGDFLKIGVYSIRHKANTVMRLAGVPGEERSLQMGHRRPDLRINDQYGEWDPSYLRKACAALEAWTRKIDRMARAKPSKVAEHVAKSHGIPAKDRVRRKSAA